MSDPGFELKPQLFEDGRLTGEILETVWRLHDMQGPPPSAIEVMVNKADLD